MKKKIHFMRGHSKNVHHCYIGWKTKDQHYLGSVAKRGGWWVNNHGGTLYLYRKTAAEALL